MSTIQFQHHQLAHCESGVTSNLLNHYGLPVSEPMVFGIGSGLFFGHFPFIKVGGAPGTTFRTWPGTIFKLAMKRMHITYHAEKFKSEEKAMQALDNALGKNIPVGMLAGVYYLTYFPDVFRFQFNAHNLVVHGKENGQYLVSDPIMKDLATISEEDLAKARFAKGTPEPGGYMYYIINTPKEIDFSSCIKKGIKSTCFFMLSPPLPWVGYKAIGFLGNRLKKYPIKHTPRKAALYLANIVRMQEEIGTGGGGFRFLYSAFLQEAAEKTGNDNYQKFSEELTNIGDDWRNFAFNAARQVKAREANMNSFNELGDMLIEIGKREKDFFTRLKKGV